MTYTKGKVSVIIPVYNSERFIREPILSALRQTYKNVEIIVVDDCSSDSSAEIIQDLQKEYSNIRYHLQPSNHGAGVARNKALEIATGQFIAFLDSDDVWHPEKLEKQLSLMEKRKSTFSYTAIEMIDEKGEIIKGKRPVRKECTYNFLLKNTMIATSSVVVDRAFFGDFRMSDRRGGQDYATWLMLLRSGCLACGIDEALVKYRVRKGSLSSNKLESIKQVWEIQVQDEKINKIASSYYVCCFIINALRKHFL